ncbi:MAG: hypothetical protein KC729_17935, partial [Candidatus Eisenbacteria bacterium]|nr:hypothetical protein [Candidatus Eisenbacteria bacterium]
SFKLAPLPQGSARLELRLPAETGDRILWDTFRAFWHSPWPLVSAVAIADGDPPSVAHASLTFEGDPELLASRRDAALDLAHRHGVRDATWTPAPETGMDRRSDTRTAPSTDRERWPCWRARLHYPPDAYPALGVMLERESQSSGTFRRISLLGSGVTWLSWREDPGRAAVVAILRAVASLGGFGVIERSPFEPSRERPHAVADPIDTNRTNATDAAGNAESSLGTGFDSLQRRIVAGLNPRGTIQPGIPLVTEPIP